ncbi:migration and invasion-inhibitory protein [Megalops cyprinoides]|uniref:migration and invasion-inhibitory protein n=1 Tax=Megalops cyprinoides TaxID=118141 RepID=UPI001863D4FA|nr:migration and invasion-inhibitory protein [Megalops cyprinoides]
MSSFERLDALRERNKDLLKQLRDKTERMHSLTAGSFPPSTRASGRSGAAVSPVTVAQEPGADTGGDGTTAATFSSDEPGERVSESLVTVPGVELGPARAALGRPRAQLNAERDQEEAAASDADSACSSAPPPQSTCRGSQPAGGAAYSGLLQDHGNRRTAQAQRAGPQGPRPILLNQDREQREAGRVKFQDQFADRQHLRPLLGYDWIAGLLDAENSLTERSEQFFTELRNFRQVNQEECVHSQREGVTEDDISPSELLAEERNPELPPDTHQCTFCYRINSRLFPVPLDPQNACPVCRIPKSQHPHTASEPAYIRVSIPRSTLLPAYRYRAHRRRSFDPSDSLGLPSHCLSGWSGRPPAAASQVGSLDLRSCVSAVHSAAVPSAQPNEDLSTSRGRVGQRSEELMGVSRLTRSRLQGDRTEPPSTTDWVY